jgi:hypothetical protein
MPHTLDRFTLPKHLQRHVLACICECMHVHVHVQVQCMHARTHTFVAHTRAQLLTCASASQDVCAIRAVRVTAVLLLCWSDACYCS